MINFMNEEQNIPVPVTPDKNQNIVPVNRWQIKSWHIIVAGVVIQAIIFIPYWGGKLKDAYDPAGLIYGSLFLFLS
jgi:hypothetical protein